MLEMMYTLSVIIQSIHLPLPAGHITWLSFGSIASKQNNTNQSTSFDETGKRIGGDNEKQMQPVIQVKATVGVDEVSSKTNRVETLEKQSKRWCRSNNWRQTPSQSTLVSSSSAFKPNETSASAQVNLAYSRSFSTSRATPWSSPRSTAKSQFIASS